MPQRVALGEEFQAAPYRRPRLGVLPSRQQRLSQPAVGDGVLGVEGEGLVVLGDGPLRIPLDVQGGAEVGVGRYELGVEGDGPAVRGDGPSRSFFSLRAAARL